MERSGYYELWCVNSQLLASGAHNPPVLRTRAAYRLHTAAHAARRRPRILVQRGGGDIVRVTIKAL